MNINLSINGTTASYVANGIAYESNFDTIKGKWSEYKQIADYRIIESKTIRHHAIIGELDEDVDYEWW